MSEEKNAPILVDLGKQKRKRVKKLRKGGGRLMDDVSQVIADLKAESKLDDSAQTVIVVVERKSKDRWKF